MLSQIRDLAALLTLLAVAFSIFANQVLLDELASDARSTLTFADHISMSVDLFFGVIVRLIIATVILGVVQFVLRAFIGGGRELTKSLRARFVLNNRSNLLSASRYALATTNSERLVVDLSGTTVDVDFHTALSRIAGNWIRAIISLCFIVLILNFLVRDTTRFDVSNVWTGPARIAEPFLISGGFLFYFIYLLRMYVFSRVNVIVDGEECPPQQLEKRFSSDALGEIGVRLERFREMALQRFAWLLALLALFAYIPFVAYLHGLSLSNSYYYKLLKLPSDTAASAIGAESSPFAARGDAVFRVIDQGVLLFDDSAQHIIFRNDEGSITVSYELKDSGFDKIGKRHACPLGVADRYSQTILRMLYIFDDIFGWQLRPCPTLAELIAKERAKADAEPADK